MFFLAKTSTIPPWSKFYHRSGLEYEYKMIFFRSSLPPSKMRVILIIYSAFITGAITLI